MKILDCTLRDGGYYTNWDFDDSLVETYALAMESSPIEYIEVGYRSMPLNGYLGKYFYCPDFVLKDLKRLMPSKKLAIILNEKDVRVEHLSILLTPIMPYVDLIRMAVAPENVSRAISLAKEVKKMGFEVAFNVMYMSKWSESKGFLESLEHLDGVVDYFYMVDSYGGVMPEDVRELIGVIKQRTDVKLGFHGHNNLEMALANTRMAIEEGCEIIDATITGMGRGAGNLRTELLLTYLDAKGEIKFNFNEFSEVVNGFELLKKQFEWGTNLPYMFSGAYSLPQKDVMEWVGLNRYPLESILNALNNKRRDVNDNEKLPVFNTSRGNSKVLIIGGGKSVLENKAAIKNFIGNYTDINLIYAGARYVNEFKGVPNEQYVTLSGLETKKLVQARLNGSSKVFNYVFPPFPRKMGTIIPEDIRQNSMEIEEITFTNVTSDSPMAIALQIALELSAIEIYTVGFDGYRDELDSDKYIIANENEKVLEDFSRQTGIELTSLTTTRYSILNTQSVYSFI